MTLYGLRRARWILWGGVKPWKRPPEREVRYGRAALGAIVRGRWRAALLYLVLWSGWLLAGAVALVPGRAQADTPPAPVEVEVIPPGLPQSLEPFLHLLNRETGYVDDAQAALLPYQRRWAYDRRKFKVCAKSRRIGITWATAFESVEVAASSADTGGMDVWYMANALDDAREFIEDCADWVGWLQPLVVEIEGASGIKEELIRDEKTDILAFTIRFSSGFKIHALTSKPRRLRGKQGLAILDEAAHHDDLWAWIKAAGAFTIWGGRVAILSTYSGVENDFYELVEEVRAGKRPAALHEITIHEALEQGLYRRICQKQLKIPWTEEGEQIWLQEIRDFYGDDFEEECECVPRKSGGTYIPHELVHTRMMLSDTDCPVLEFKPSRDLDRKAWGKAETWDHVPVDQRAREMRRWLDANLGPYLKRIAEAELYGGVDFGRVRNLTILTLLELRHDMTRRARLVIELDEVPFDQQSQVLDYVWERCEGVARVCLDARGLGHGPSEHARDQLGERADMVHLSPGWYAEHWPELKRRFEDGAIELPNHKPLFDDLKALRRVGGKVEIGGKNQKRHGDGAVSLLLAEAATGTKAEAAHTDPVSRWGLGKSKKRRRR